MKSVIMNTMEIGADQCLQLNLSDTSHCINLPSVARIFAQPSPISDETSHDDCLPQAGFQKKKEEKKKRGFTSYLKQGQGKRFHFAHVKRNLMTISLVLSSHFSVICA